MSNYVRYFTLHELLPWETLPAFLATISARRWRLWKIIWSLWDRCGIVAITALHSRRWQIRENRDRSNLTVFYDILNKFFFFNHSISSVCLRAQKIFSRQQQRNSCQDDIRYFHKNDLTFKTFMIQQVSLILQQCDDKNRDSCYTLIK